AVSGSEDRTIRFWDVKNRKEMDRYKSDCESIECVVFSPDGGLVLAGSDEGIVEVWDVRSGRLYRVLDGATGRLTSIALSKNGRQVVAASPGGSIPHVWQWDLETRKEVACFRDPSNPGGSVECVAVTSNAQRVVSGGQIRHLHRQRRSGDT